MEVRVLDLDGGLMGQPSLRRCFPEWIAAQDWGPRLRLACSFGRFAAFERTLAERLGGETDSGPTLTFCGSGDFHHVSLALLRRQQRPFNLVVIDNHPDWMRRIPLLHCGTWLAHALELSNVRRVFHLGGEVDFDNYFRWFAPWSHLRSGKLVVLPAVRRFRGSAWSAVAHQPLRTDPTTPFDAVRVEEVLAPYRKDLARWPLYLSLDKDVMTASEATVNWDSGWLQLREIQTALALLRDWTHGRWAGADVVGDWSPVHVQGWLRRLLHATEHPSLQVDPAAAARCNDYANRCILAALTPHVAAVAA
jgi:hypothetical protein